MGRLHSLNPGYTVFMSPLCLSVSAASASLSRCCHEDQSQGLSKEVQLEKAPVANGSRMFVAFSVTAN